MSVRSDKLSARLSNRHPSYTGYARALHCVGISAFAQKQSRLRSNYLHTTNEMREVACKRSFSRTKYSSGARSEGSLSRACFHERILRYGRSLSPKREVETASYGAEYFLSWLSLKLGTGGRCTWETLLAMRLNTTQPGATSVDQSFHHTASKMKVRILNTKYTYRLVDQVLGRISPSSLASTTSTFRHLWNNGDEVLNVSLTHA